MPFDHFRFSATLRAVRALPAATAAAALAAAPEAALAAARGAGATLPAAVLALAAQHQADLHLCDDAVALAELVGAAGPGGAPVVASFNAG